MINQEKTIQELYRQPESGN